MPVRQDEGMSLGGTAAYQGLADLPTIVRQAVKLARRLSFDASCRPEQGRLLQVLAAGRCGGVIGETGAGCGVGLGWLASGAGPGTRLLSVEADPERASATARLFAPHENVAVLRGDWTALLDHAPFDLLVLDGGGAGKGEEEAVDVTAVLSVGSTVVIDDFTPAGEWPPLHRGQPDRARLRWLQHPCLLATELRLAADLASIVATRVR